jgi:hypothetical protein
MLVLGLKRQVLEMPSLMVMTTEPSLPIFEIVRYVGIYDDICQAMKTKVV